MTKLLEIKEWLKRFYSKFDVYLQAVWKFILSAGAITVLNQNIGFMNQLKSPIIVLILGLICSILPYGGIALICAAITLAHFYALSLELAGVALIAFLLMYLFCLRFENKASYALILTPLLFWMKIPYLAPILVGLTGGMAGALPVGCGVMIYSIIAYAKESAPSLSSSTVDNILETIRIIIDGLLGNKAAFVMIAAFVITVLIVHLIKSLSVDYAWMIAIGVGTVVDVLILMVGDFTMDIEIEIVGMIVGSLITILISLVIQFFLFSVDYSRTEHVQFEDDEYVYYVKAVPKMIVTSKEVNVKRINAQKSQRSKNTSERGNSVRMRQYEEEEDLPRGRTAAEIRATTGNKNQPVGTRNQPSRIGTRTQQSEVSSASVKSTTPRSEAVRVARNGEPIRTARSGEAVRTVRNKENIRTARSGSMERTPNVTRTQRSSQNNITNIQDRIIPKPTTHTTDDK